MRKRIYSTIIAVASSMVMLVQPVCAEIPEIDYGSMSNEELITLRDTINEKIAENGGDNTIGGGTFVVGEDIKAGTYKLTADPSYEGFVKYLIFKDVDEYNQYQDGDYDIGKEVSFYSNQDGTKSGNMNLKNGEIVYNYCGSAIIQEVKSSWMVDETDKKDKK